MDTDSPHDAGQQRTEDNVSIAMYLLTGAGLLVMSAVVGTTSSGELRPALAFGLARMNVVGGALLAIGCIAQGIVVARR
jgi:hypothetical protein